MLSLLVSRFLSSNLCRAAEQLILARDPLDEIRRAFKLFDTEGTGRISLRDLKKVARELGENLEEDELYVQPLSPLSEHIDAGLNRARSRRKAMIEEFDLDMDGAISEQEFIKSVRLPFHSVLRGLTDEASPSRIMSDDV